MKLFRLSLILFLTICSQLAFSQETPWTGKYQLVFDPDNPSAFILQVVPDNDGNSWIGGSTVVQVITDPEAGEYTIESLDGGSWELFQLAEGTSLICGRLLELRHTTPTGNISVTEGEPLDLIRFIPVEDLDCPVGRGVRLY